MLWRFGYASTSSIDTLLARETPPSMEELMDEQDILAECKARNNKLMYYLTSKEAVSSLLHWVIAGLDDLEHEAALADSQSLDQAMSSSDIYPSYRPFESTQAPPPGLSPDSPPLEPAKMADELLEGGDKGLEATPLESASSIGLGQGLERHESRDESQRSRFPHIATEILTSDMWTIGDTLTSNPDELLKPFWDAMFPNPEPSTPSTESSISRQEISERQRIMSEFRSDKDDERDRKTEVIRGMWTRVNGHFLAKRTKAMIDFIKSQPNIVERIMLRMSSSATQDLLIRIISCEDDGTSATTSGVIDWLASEGLIPRLIALLSPEHPPSMHIIATDILTSIITLCAPSAFNPAGGNNPESSQPGQPGQEQARARDNRLLRELVSESNISTLVGFMLDDVELSDASWSGLEDDATHPADPFIIHPLPSLASASSSFSAVCAIFVELIRRNNSDFSEPHLFHTLRNRLMWVRAKNNDEPVEIDEEAERKEMEDALVECVNKHGIVHLGALLTAISDRFEKLHSRLLHPRTQKRSASALLSTPLTLERFRAVELYAELLHSSNMSMLNRLPDSGPVYSSEGILSGGLDGLEALGEAIDTERIDDDHADPEEMITQAKELPVSNSAAASVVSSDEEDVASDDEVLENMDDLTPSPSPSASGILPAPLPIDVPTPKASQPDLPNQDLPQSPTNAPTVSPQTVIEPSPVLRDASPDMSSTQGAEQEQSNGGDRRTKAETDGDGPLAPGDRLKSMYIKHRVLATVIDLFFEYPSNDFMHHVVYDLLQQILNGNLGAGWNRELIVDLIKEAKLVERILEAQRLNDERMRRPRTARLPYMGHIVLISEELVKFFARCPEDLMLELQSSFDLEAWENFVQGSLTETKEKDTTPLAGGRPALGMTGLDGQVQTEDDSSDDESDEEDKARFGEPLTRTKAKDGFSNREDSEAVFEEFGDHAEADQTWRTSRRTADSSDEDEDDAGWLRPSVRNFDATESDDEDFGAFQTTGDSSSGAARSQDFDDDDAWGTFSSASPSASDQDNPFGDDNFATFTPSVPPVPSAPSSNANDHFNLHQDPLTPHDWASQFDREFDQDNLTSVPLNESEGESSRPSVVIPGKDEEGPERQILVPEMEDSPVNEKNSPWTALRDTGSPSLKASAGSGWTLAGGAGDEPGELPPAIATPAVNLGSPPAPAPTPLPIPTMTANKSPPVTAAKLSPSLSPASPRLFPSRARSHSSTSSGSTETPLSPRHGPQYSRKAPGPSSPITIPQRSPSSHSDIPTLGALSPRMYPSPGTELKGGIRSTSPIPGISGMSSHPVGSPISPRPASSKIKPSPTFSTSPSHHRSSSMNSVHSGSTSSPGSSPLRRIRRLSVGSPPDKALFNAVSKESPLGPGVSPDTHLMSNGMLEKEIDGKKMTVPADEVIMGVEEAEAERLDPVDPMQEEEEA